LLKSRGRVQGASFKIRVPVVYRSPTRFWVRSRPIAGVPDVSVLLDQQSQYAPARVPIERDLRVELRGAAEQPREVRLEVKLPAGLIADSATRTVTVPAAGTTNTVTFKVRGQLPADTMSSMSRRRRRPHVRRGLHHDRYEHITARRIYRPSRMSLEAVDIAAANGMRVGYIAGVSDNSAAAPRAAGHRRDHDRPGVAA
jgi:hypothetical protein